MPFAIAPLLGFVTAKWAVFTAYITALPIWAYIVSVPLPTLAGFLKGLAGTVVATILSFFGYRWVSGAPKVVEYSLFGLNSASLTFFIAVAFLAAYLFLEDSKKHRSTLLLLAAPLSFSLYAKLMMFIFKWDISSIFGEVGRLLSGNANAEHLIVVVFTLLLVPCVIIACSAELSLFDFVIGFVFLSFDALISQSFYILTLPHLSPFINNVPASEITILSLVTSVFIAYLFFYLVLALLQAFWSAFIEAKKEFYNSELYAQMNDNGNRGDNFY